jgi:hypothetical protein
VFENCKHIILVFLKNEHQRLVLLLAEKKWCEKYYTLPLVAFSPVGRKLFRGIQHGTSIIVCDVVALLCVL